MDQQRPDRLAELLERGLQELGLTSDAPGPEDAAQTSARLAHFSRMVERWGEAMNLTGHRGSERIARRLVLDSLAMWSSLQALEPSGGRLADLGSGAGFPGLPIAISRPDWRVVLVESRQRRHYFQRAVRRDLGLENVETLRARIEELTPRVSDVVVAQALARPSRALGQMIDWARPGGLLLIPGAGEAPRPGDHPEVLECGALSYEVPLDGPKRTLWWGRRRMREGA